MNIFSQSLMRLYQQGEVSAEKIYSLLQNEKITREEYLTILGKEEKDE